MWIEVIFLALIWRILEMYRPWGCVLALVFFAFLFWVFKTNIHVDFSKHTPKHFPWNSLSSASVKNPSVAMTDWVSGWLLACLMFQALLLYPSMLRVSSWMLQDGKVVAVMEVFEHPLCEFCRILVGFVGGVRSVLHQSPPPSLNWHK